MRPEPVKAGSSRTMRTTENANDTHARYPRPVPCNSWLRHSAIAPSTRPTKANNPHDPSTTTEHRRSERAKTISEKEKTQMLTAINFNAKEIRLLKAILSDEANRLDRRLRDFRQGSESQRLAENDKDDVLRLLKTIKMMETR